MKHVCFSLLSLAVAGALSACGGGSSDGGVAVQTTPSTPSANTSATANNTSSGRVTSTTNNTASNTSGNTNPTNTTSNPTANTNTSGTTNIGGTSSSNTTNTSPNTGSNTNNTSGAATSTGGNTGGTTPNTANTGSNTNTSPTQTVISVTNKTSSLSSTTNTAPASDKRYASLTVDGKTYQLLDVNAAPRILHESEDTKQQVVASGHLSYMRYGMIHDKTNGRHYLYHMGDRTPTATMPTTGGGTYTGRAVHVDYKKAKTTTNVNSVFHVDFAEKTVKGAITGPDAPDGKLTLNATISGNSFRGNTGGTTVNGVFYSSQAQELGGTYINDHRQFGGAFGAVKP